MIAVVNALLFVGYTLVYAAVEHGGQFAARPWDALRVRAGSAAASSTSSGAVNPNVQTGSAAHKGGGILGTVTGIAKGVLNLEPGLFLP